MRRRRATWSGRKVAILLTIAEIALNDNLNDAPAQQFGSLINSNTPRFLKRLTGLTPCSET